MEKMAEMPFVALVNRVIVIAMSTVLAMKVITQYAALALHAEKESLSIQCQTIQIIMICAIIIRTRPAQCAIVVVQISKYKHNVLRTKMSCVNSAICAKTTNKSQGNVKA